MDFKLKGSHMTSDQVKALLNDKYSLGDECLIAFEVNEGTGSSAGRRIDAIAMSLWPSKDYKIIGFEIKVSRADWLNELKQPEKSFPIAQFCDEFYLVAPAGVLGIDEIPKTWGYIQASEKSLLTKIRAPKREAIQTDRPFMASLIRSLVKKYQNKNLIAAQVDNIRIKMEDDFQRRTKADFRHLNDEISSLNNIIHDFNTQTGMKMNRYNFGNIVEVVKMMNDAKSKNKYVSDLTNQITCLESILSFSKKSLDALTNLKMVTPKE
jgi:hypothetical protein